MEKRKLWASLLFTAFTLVVLCATLTVSTYAWFTFDPYTNVTPVEGKISDGDTNLLISESKDGPFDKECELNPAVLTKVLQPVSTADLERFYASIAQNRKGISTNYKEVTDQLDSFLVQGTVYLQSLGTGSDVYVSDAMKILGANEEVDDQIIAAGRLGLHFTKENGDTEKYILYLDTLGKAAEAKAIRTISSEKEKAVIAAIDENGVPAGGYSDDPAVSIGDYKIDADNAKKLCTVDADEIVKVDYWFYLEGCDDDCSDPVQSRDVITLSLGFVGERATGGE